MSVIHNGRPSSERKCRTTHVDPTANKAITKVDLERMDEEDRFRNLLDTVYYISDLAGFDIQEKIVLCDRRTGKVWKG